MTENSDQKLNAFAVKWRDIPSYFTDGILGSTSPGGNHRLTFGEFIFDHDENATHPALRPTLNLIIPNATLDFLIDYLINLRDKKNEDEGKE